MANLQKRSFTLAGHATSVAVEPEFWAVLSEMAAEQSLGLAALVTRLDQSRRDRPLASACRLAALDWTRSRKDARP